MHTYTRACVPSMCARYHSEEKSVSIVAGALLRSSSVSNRGTTRREREGSGGVPVSPATWGGF